VPHICGGPRTKWGHNLQGQAGGRCQRQGDHQHCYTSRLPNALRANNGRKGNEVTFRKGKLRKVGWLSRRYASSAGQRRERLGKGRANALGDHCLETHSPATCKAVFLSESTMVSSNVAIGRSVVCWERRLLVSLGCKSKSARFWQAHRNNLVVLPSVLS